MKKGSAVIKRIIAGMLTLMLVVSLLPTQLAAEAVELSSTGNMTFDASSTELIAGTGSITLTATETGLADGGDEVEYITYEDVETVYNVRESYRDTIKEESWTWVSKNSDISISYTDNIAIVTAAASGTARITATYNFDGWTYIVTDVVETTAATADTPAKYSVTVEEAHEYISWSGTCEVTAVYDTPASITLNDTSLTLNLVDKKTATLTATLTGKNGGTVDPNSVTWSSSDESVATVSGGAVTAVGVGTTTITASVGSVTATCAVTVENTTNTGGAVTLEYGDSTALSVTDQDGTVTWSSSDTGVATVDSDGQVTAVGVGTATVTAVETGTGYTTTTTFAVTVEAKELTVVYNSTVITKESDGTTAVTDDNKIAIGRTLFLSSGKVDNDDVSFTITDYGAYSGSTVGEHTITVTVELTGDAKENYTLSDTTIRLDAEITAATPTESTLDLTTTGATLSLTGSEIITFTAPTYEDADGNLWFTSGDILELKATGEYSYALYNDETCKSGFDRDGMTEGARSTKTLYVKNEITGVVYGPITVIYNYDATAPTVTSVATGNTEGAIDFASDELTYTVTVSDTGSGVNKDSICYYITTDSTTDVSQIPGWTSGSDIQKNEDGTYSFTIDVPSTGYLYVVVSDYAGNDTVTAVSRALVIEANAPTVTLDTADFYTFTVTASDKVTDAAANNTYYSGIASITLTLEGTAADGSAVSETKTVTYDVPSSYSSLAGAMEQTESVALPGYFDGVSSGTYTLTVTATDFCGNISNAVSVSGIVIDNDAPTATLTMNGETVYGNVDGNGTYYYNATNAGFTVTVDDDNISQGVYYTVTAADEYGDEVSMKGTATNADNNAIEISAGQLSLLKDGTVTVTVYVYDAAWNITDELTCASDIEANVSGMTFSFVLDTIAPTLDSVTMTSGSYYDSDSAVYYNGDFDVVYSITEENLYADGVTLGSASPTADSTGTLGDDATMSISGNTVTVSVTATDDVENSIYQPTVTVTDKAGNAMVSNNATANYGYVTVGSGTGIAKLTTALVLDTLAPKLTSTSSTESDHYYSGDSRVYYNDAFAVTYKVTEVNYDSSQDVWTVTQTGDGSAAVLSTTSGVNATYTATVAYQASVEDAAYTPSLSVKDKAGNVLEANENAAANDYDTVTASNGTATADTAFVLDTTAPVFTLSLADRTDTDPDTDSYAYYNTDITAAFTVTDANLDDGKTAVAVASNTSATTYDAATVSWEAMTLTQSDSAYGSSSWSQTLTASADGVYRFEVAAEDCAGNQLVQSDESGLDTYKTTTAHGSGQFWTTYYLVRDTVAPELEVTMTADGSAFYNATLLSGGYTVSQNSPYQPYSSATATLEKADCSPTSVAYTFSSTADDQTERGSAYDYSDLAVTLSGQQIFTISQLQITDRAGNVTAMSGETNKFYLDAEAPEMDEFSPTVAVEAARGGDGIDLYDQDVIVRAVVTDPDGGVSSSGLYQVYYKVLVNGEDWTEQVSVSSASGSVTSAGTIGYGTSGSGYSSTAAVDEAVTSQDTILFTFDADAFQDNDVAFYVWAEDNSGNLLSEADAAYYLFTFKAAEQEATIDGFTDVPYDGAAHEVTVTAADDAVVTVTYTDADGAVVDAPVDVGIYTAHVVITRAGYNTLEQDVTVSIVKATQVISYASASVSKAVGDDAFINDLTETVVYGEITYASSDTSVATVDANGKVTIVGAGTATITATASGSDNYTEATASYTLTVDEAASATSGQDDDGSDGSSASTSSTSSSSSTSAVKSRDEANLVFWSVLLLAACGGLAAAVIYLRRKQK